MTPVGLPHSEIPGSKRACRSPRHIAACHVLHRLSVPRHPPSTLSNLTIKCLDLMRSAVPLSSVGSSQFAVGRSFFSCLLPTCSPHTETCCASLSTYPYSIVKETGAGGALKTEQERQGGRTLAVPFACAQGRTDSFRPRTSSRHLAMSITTSF